MTMTDEELKQARVKDKERLKKRLEGLKAEVEVIDKLEYLSFNAKDVCFSWYGHEIKCCEDRLKEYKAYGI